jgi:hypothetical protein
MSQDFRKVLVKDDRLLVTDQVSYAVLKGGQNMTCQRFNAIGSSPFTSNINFNLQIPSQETIVSRNVLMSAQLEFTITGSTVNNGGAATDSQTGLGYLFHYGGSDCFGPLVFNQLITSQQYTINNTTVSQNTRDILAVILRMHDKRWLSRYNGMTPSAFDTYFAAPPMFFSNTAGITTLNNPAAGFNGTSMDNDLMPRGAFPLDSISCVLVSNTATASNNYLPAGTARIVTVRITVTEPVLISPFTFAGDDGCGFYGIQNLSAIINLDQTANTAIRFGTGTGLIAGRFGTGPNNAIVLPTVRFTGAYVPQLLFQLLTPHASDLLPARNVVPYYELPRYITTCNAIAAGGSISISSQSLQLNMIPDKLLISIGKPISARTPGDSDSWLAITGISINWNNTSGLLSSATPQDLWRMSTENGVNQTWSEFRGFAQGSPYVEETQGLYQVQTCGSVLCLEFGKDIQLSEDYYAPGSLGNFQLQFNIIVQNLNPTVAIPANAYQLLTVVQNSGIFSIERGVSSSYLGVLTKTDVLEASRQESTGYSSGLRMIGGGEVPSQFARLKATMGKVQGKGESGGMSSGMGMSAGKKHKKKVDMGGLEDRM